MKRVVITLLIVLGIGSSGWAQQEDAVSSDQINQLLERIERLEQTVQELREQVGPQDASPESPGETSTAEVTQPLVQTQSQDSPASDPGVRISGLLFGDYYWMADHHDPVLKDRNGFWVRRTSGVRVAMERNPCVFRDHVFILCVTALAAWMLPTPCRVVLGGESGNRLGPRTHVARERPEVSMA